jgi:glutamyl-tRNA reductase
VVVAIAFIGTDFNDAPLALLDQLERESAEIQRRLVAQNSPILGAVVLATCNRFEVYFESKDFHGALDFAMQQIATHLGNTPEQLSEQLRVLYGPALVKHIFSVAAGLESMVVGEAEITGQVKRALSIAQNTGVATTEIQKLFQSASSVAKRVISETGLGASGRSIISVALDIATDRIGTLRGKSALIIGTGAYARVSSAALKRLGVKTIYVYSKSGRAESFASSHELVPVLEEDLLTCLTEVDLVVGTSGSPGRVVEEELALRAASKRTSQLVVIDVALSKDIAPEVSNLRGFSVIDLEQLKLLTPKDHTDAVISAEAIVAGEVSNYQSELVSRSMDPVISALRAHVSLWVEAEIESVRKKQGDEIAKGVERSLNRVTNAILHTPTIKAKDLAKDGNQEDYLRAVRLLFDLELGKDA